jgi:hypothetical protein
MKSVHSPTARRGIVVIIILYISKFTQTILAMEPAEVEGQAEQLKLLNSITYPLMPVTCVHAKSLVSG